MSRGVPGERRLRPGGLFLLVLGGSLLALDGAGTRAEPPARPAAAPVAFVAGEAVGTDELSAFWFSRYRESWLKTVENLVDERIVEREARRLGITVPPARVDEAVQAEVAARMRQLKETYGPDVKLEDEVRRAYGLDVAAWRTQILRPRLERQLLLQRIVRLDTRRRPRLEVRVIVLADEAAARRVVEKLRRGADFSLTALKESIDPTAKVGGTLPLLARGDLAWPEVEEALFAARPGEIVGPLAVRVDGVMRWQVYKVIRATQAWTGSRADVLARLEKDLEARPVEAGEFQRWRARCRHDFRVRLLDPEGRPLPDR